jgi:hypothetical protein
MFGFESKEEAKKAYLSNYSPGWRGFMAITEVDVEKFRKWLHSGRKQRKPFSEYKNINEDNMKKVTKITEKDLHRIVKNAVARILNENKLTRDDDYSYPKKGDEDADLDAQYDKWKSEQEPTQEDWDDFGEWASSDEPDLWGDEMAADMDDIGPIDADDEGEGYSRSYHSGVKYMEKLISMDRVPKGMYSELNRREVEGTITAYELGMLDTLDDALHEN